MKKFKKLQHLVRLSALSLFIVSSFAFAAPIKNTSNKIVEIKTEGLSRIERDAIIEKISSKPGTEYSKEQTRTDIDAIYGMGYFDDIQILKDQAADGIHLTFKFKERPVVDEVIFEGNDKIATSDLEEVIKVKKWNIVDVNKIQADIDLLQKHYEDKGYYLAKITYELRPVKDGEVKLVYLIQDYDKVEIKQIVFLNNKSFQSEKLRSVFQETKEGTSLSFLSSTGTFKEASFKNDLQRLIYFYLDQGYVKFRYENPVITVSEDKKYVYIAVYLEEGEQYSVSSYDYSGDLLFSKEELDKEVKLRPGKVFSISERNADIQRLTEKYQDLGYAFVNVTPKMEFNEEAKTLAVDYSFEKGNLVHFGEIRIVGNTKTYDKVIRRELRIYEGELFSGSKLRISKERVERLGYFAPGELQFNQVPRKGRDDLLDIEITVKERSTGSVTVGAGYSSVQGFFFQGKIQEINLLGRGQNLGLEIQWGREDTVRSVSLDFMDPYAFDTDWSAGFTLFMSNSPIPNRYLTRRAGVHLKLGHPLTDDVQGFITYKLEQLRVLSMYTRDAIPALGIPALVADPSLDVGILSSVVLSVVRDVRNNRFETTDGNYQSASVEYAGLAGVKNFTKVTANNRYYNNFFGNFVFKNSTEAGAIANSGGKGTPPAERFYLGGPFNMRGYESFSLAPFVLRPGNAYEQIGGASEFYSLFELEHPLIKEAGIKWVLFYDIGNAFSGVPLFDTKQGFELRQDWGFGIRWFSPLGPLRFEWGFPINRKYQIATNSVEDSPVFIFFIGQPF